MSNVCVAKAYELLDETNVAIIYVGGIPVEKTPPLHYQTVYALETVFDTYARDVRFSKNKKEKIAEPLSDLEILTFDEPIGELEAFNTNGLASLLITMGDKITDILIEKTLRYPGHVEKIKFLAECGLLDDNPLKIKKCQISPLDVVIQQLRPMLTLGPEGDILVMRIIVKGKRNGAPEIHTFELIDYFNHETNYSAMGRTTTFPATCAARMIANNMINETGVRFPEQIFSGKKYDHFMNTLREHNIHITHYFE